MPKTHFTSVAGSPVANDPAVPGNPRKGDTVYMVVRGVGPDGRHQATRYAMTDPDEFTRIAFVEKINGNGTVNLAVWNGIQFEKVPFVQYDGSKKGALTWHGRDE